MKTILSIIICVLGFSAFAQKISDLPETSSISNTYLFILAKPGVANYKFTYSNLLNSLEADLNLSGIAGTQMVTTAIGTLTLTNGISSLRVLGEVQANSAFVTNDLTAQGTSRLGTLKVSQSAGINNLYVTNMAGTGDILAADSDGRLLRTNITGSSGSSSFRRIIAYEGDSLVNQALPVWPRFMDTNSPWFAQSTVETNWGANGDTLLNMDATYVTEAHLNRPTNNSDEALFLLHAGFNDYNSLGRTDGQLYNNMTSIWAKARADKWKVVAMPITGHTNLSAMVLSNLSLFDYMVRVDVMLSNTNNTNSYYDTVHPTPNGANAISRAVATVVDKKPWMLVNAREETNSALPMLMDLVINPAGRYVGIGAAAPQATLHLRGTNAGQNVLRIDHSDGTPRFQFGTYPSGGDQYATVWGPAITPNGTNYFLSANTNTTVVNGPDSLALNIGHSVKLYLDSAGSYVAGMGGTGDHVAVRSDGLLMRTNISGGVTIGQFLTDIIYINTLVASNLTNTGSIYIAPPISAVQFNSNGVQRGSTGFVFTNGFVGIGTTNPSAKLDVPGEARIGTLVASNTSGGVINATTLNVANITLTNALGSNQVRLGMAQLTNVSFTSLVEGNSLFYNAANGIFTNAPGGSGSGSTQMVTAAIGKLTQTNDISFVVSNQANLGSWLIPAKSNYANAFVALGGGTNHLGETVFDNNVSIATNLSVPLLTVSSGLTVVNTAGNIAVNVNAGSISTVNGSASLRLQGELVGSAQHYPGEIMVMPDASGGGNSIMKFGASSSSTVVFNMALNAVGLGLGTTNPLAPFHVVGGIVQTNGGIWQHFSIGAPSAPAANTQGAVLWNDGTNWCTVFRNGAGTLATNKLNMSAWP